MADYSGTCFILSSDNATVIDGQRNYSTNPYDLPVRYQLNYQLESAGFTDDEIVLANLFRKDPIMVVNATSEPLGTISFQDMTTLPAAFTILKDRDSYIRGKLMWKKSSPSADKCVLYSCVNEYNLRAVDRTVQHVVRLTEFWRNNTSFGDSTNPTFVSDSTVLRNSNIQIHDVILATEAVRSCSSTPALWNPKGTIFGERLRRMDLQLMVESEDDIQKTFSVIADAIFSTVHFVQSWTVDHTVDDTGPCATIL